jgi:histidyl-tRNA synthetase
VEEKGLTAETADRIGTFVKEKGHPLTLLSKLKQEGSAFLENAGSVDALNDLEILFNALDKSKRLDKVVFDLSLARGLDYYTGVIFEAVFKGGAQVILMSFVFSPHSDMFLLSSFEENNALCQPRYCGCSLSCTTLDATS